MARVHGLLRRADWTRARADRAQASAAPEPPDRYSFGGRTIDFDRLMVHTGTRAMQLTAMEAKLLQYLVQHANHTVSRGSILEDEWGVHEDTDTRAIDNFIVRLRRYLEDDPSEPRHLLTVRGVGYRFVPEPDRTPADRW
jgi:DNA-binding response OmpR family regulator